jgi:transcription initiation factor IIE alpha subunit
MPRQNTTRKRVRMTERATGVEIEVRVLRALKRRALTKTEISVAVELPTRAIRPALRNLERRKKITSAEGRYSRREG